MTHRSVHEWGRVEVGGNGFSIPQAEMLIAAARAHPLGGEAGERILSDHRHFLRARQMVGVIATPDCSLEILPKVDSGVRDEDAPAVRQRLVALLDLALGLDLESGTHVSMAHGAESLLDIFIRLFARQLLMQTRRGLPRLYSQYEENLPALRGRLDVARQFTQNAVRPDRLACRYDVLSSDIPLLQIVKATVVFLAKLCRTTDTLRILNELRFVLADITDVSPFDMPWDKVRIDRTTRNWERSLALARLFMQRDWQATHRSSSGREGYSLLFPMNDLFEAAIATLLCRGFAGSDIEVTVQGGRRYCLGGWSGRDDCIGDVFQTRPDIILKRGSRVIAVIDTKWKRLSVHPLDSKGGIGQADIYQMMAYARIYKCNRLALLYPATPESGSGVVRRFGIDGGRELLALMQVDISVPTQSLQSRLMAIVNEVLESECYDSITV